MIKKIFATATNFNHLKKTSILFGGLSFLILWVIIPVAVGIYGDMLFSAKTWELPIINIIWTFSAVIILFPVIIFCGFINYKKKDFAKTKNYLYVAILVLAITGIINFVQSA